MKEDKLFWGNFKTRIDRQGRISIPSKLRDDLGKEAVIVAGCGDHIEIWEEKQWAREQPKMKKILDKILK